MLLYLLDTFLNILCELLISKQSRYNFLVSVLVEITEIVICLVLMYRFATMVVTLFFWLPIDILSFINWSRHKEKLILFKIRAYRQLLPILMRVHLRLVLPMVCLFSLDCLNNGLPGISVQYLNRLSIYYLVNMYCWY